MELQPCLNLGAELRRERELAQLRPPASTERGHIGLSRSIALSTPIPMHFTRHSRRRPAQPPRQCSAGLASRQATGQLLSLSNPQLAPGALRRSRWDTAARRHHLPHRAPVTTHVPGNHGNWFTPCSPCPDLGPVCLGHLGSCRHLPPPSKSFTLPITRGGALTPRNRPDYPGMAAGFIPCDERKPFGPLITKERAGAPQSPGA